MNSDESKSLALHLYELRRLIITIIIFLFAGFIISFAFLTDKVLRVIERPLALRNIKIVYTALTEVFVCKIELSIIIGAIITSPFILFFLWRFVKPALYQNEIKKFRVLFFFCLRIYIVTI